MKSFNRDKRAYFGMLAVIAIIVLLSMFAVMGNAHAADKVTSTSYTTTDNRQFEIVDVDTGSHKITCIFTGPSGVHCVTEKKSWSRFDRYGPLAGDK